VFTIVVRTSQRASFPPSRVFFPAGLFTLLTLRCITRRRWMPWSATIATNVGAQIIPTRDSLAASGRPLTRRVLDWQRRCRRALRVWALLQGPLRHLGFRHGRMGVVNPQGINATEGFTAVPTANNHARSARKTSALHAASYSSFAPKMWSGRC
jgi:hypothetical protein